MSWMRNSRGHSNGTAKLTEQQAQLILDAPTLEEARQMCIDAGVSKTVADKIRNKKSWAHLRRSVPLELQ